MGRLKEVRLRLAPAPSRLPKAPQPEGGSRWAARVAEAPWRRWYGLRQWRDLSWQVRVDEAFTCRRCGRIDGEAGQTVADHIVPHRGEPGLFWARENLQCLCKGCHDRDKQREDARR